MSNQAKEKKLEESQLPIMNPHLNSAMYGMQIEDEIDLLEYWQVIWKKKWLIVSVSLLAAILAVGISLTMPNIYRAEALLAPVGEEGNKGGGLSSMLGGLGGLASMAGVSIGGGGSVEQNIAVLKSRKFIWSFVKDEKLMPVLFAEAWDAKSKKWLDPNPDNQPSLWDAWRLFIGILSVGIDKKSGLVTLAIEWSDPELASVWVMKLIEKLNAHLREQSILKTTQKMIYLKKELVRTHIEENRKALFELISVQQKKAMLANTEHDFSFRVIDAAFIPDKKVKPKRAIIVILSSFMVGFLCIIFVFIQEGVRKRREGSDV